MLLATRRASSIVSIWLCRHRLLSLGHRRKREIGRWRRAPYSHLESARRSTVAAGALLNHQKEAPDWKPGPFLNCPRLDRRG